MAAFGRPRLLSDPSPAGCRSGHRELIFGGARPGGQRHSEQDACLGLLTGKTELKRGIIAAAPNGSWQNAQPFELGQTIFGSDDERPYAPSKSEDGYAAMVKGFQWFRFTFREKQPKLVYFVLNVTDRDVPYDVDIFQAGKDSSGQADVVPFTDGEFVYQVEATQNYPGLYRFRTRIFQPGQEYYVRVAANHPAYQLHTYQYNVPPNKDPQEAVRAGMDFLINMGDYWLSNTPRRGAVAHAHHHAALRDPVVHRLPSLTVHLARISQSGGKRLCRRRSAQPRVHYRSHLQQRSPAIRRAQHQLGADHLYCPDRLQPPALIAHAFEQNVTHDQPRKNFDLPYAEFLKIHYKGVTVMPGDESDGCEPDVSPFEIASRAGTPSTWRTTKATSRIGWPNAIMSSSLAMPYEPKNMIDLNWKIMFFSEINRQKYASQIEALINKLYEFESPDGGWPYPFDKQAKPADFISYNSVLALAEAGRAAGNRRTP